MTSLASGRIMLTGYVPRGRLYATTTLIALAPDDWYALDLAQRDYLTHTIARHGTDETLATLRYWLSRAALDQPNDAGRPAVSDPA